MESQEPHNIDFNYKKFKKKLENPLIHIINIYAFFSQSFIQLKKIHIIKNKNYKI